MDFSLPKSVTLFTRDFRFLVYTPVYVRTQVENYLSGCKINFTLRILRNYSDYKNLYFKSNSKSNTYNEKKKKNRFHIN